MCEAKVSINYPGDAGEAAVALVPVLYQLVRRVVAGTCILTLDRRTSRILCSFLKNNEYFNRKIVKPQTNVFGR